jgi:hypothetical protein
MLILLTACGLPPGGPKCYIRTPLLLKYVEHGSNKSTYYTEVGSKMSQLCFPHCSLHLRLLDHAVVPPLNRNLLVGLVLRSLF